jgi:glycosyltransferase involved in cell wall biosynthesis
MAKVSFIVPCYNLAHLLSECLNSILVQTYRDFEILIMDDCSPDNSTEIAQKFGDPRIVYVRNEINLGHLRNYNKGIELSRGDYVWLISADDRLRCSYILEKYVDLMEKHPEVGFVFCPGVGLKAGQETGLLSYSHHGDKDVIFDGRKLLDKLLESNSVIAASGMVRRTLYDRFGTFPLDLPYAGDWYLWCLFSLYYDVGYFAEPMVNYREHELSMTKRLDQNDARVKILDDIAVLWRIRRALQNCNYRRLLTKCDERIIAQYSVSLAYSKYGNRGITPDEFEKSLEKFTTSEEEAKQMRIGSYLRGGDLSLWNQKRSIAKVLYKRAVYNDPMCPEALVKYLLLICGRMGDQIRGLRSFLRFTSN